MNDLSALQRTVGLLTLENGIVIGAGTCKTLADVKRASRTHAGGIEIGSISLHPKPGNDGNTFYAHYNKGVLMYTINSLGLINPGKENVSTWAAEAIKIAHDAGKKIGINVVGDNLTEIVDLVLWAVDLGFDWVTVNAGCPNKYEDGKPVAVLGFDEDNMTDLCDLLDRHVGVSGQELWLKPPPFTDTVGALPRFAAIVSECESVTAVVSSNTVAHCHAQRSDGSSVIDPGDGLGGMGGPAVKPIAEGHIKKLGTLLPGRTQRIASGGVMTGQDAVDYFRLGARLVQVTSAIWAPTMRGHNLDYNAVDTIVNDLLEHPDVPRLMAA